MPNENIFHLSLYAAIWRAVKDDPDCAQNWEAILTQSFNKLRVHPCLRATLNKQAIFTASKEFAAQLAQSEMIDTLFFERVTTIISQTDINLENFAIIFASMVLEDGIVSENETECLWILASELGKHSNFFEQYVRESSEGSTAHAASIETSQQVNTLPLAQTVTKTPIPPALDATDYLNALETLARKGRDGIGTLGHALGTGTGAVAGLGVASLAAAASSGGAASVFLGALGVVAAPSLPLLAGLGLVGAGVGYVTTKFIKSGAKQDESRAKLRESLRQKITGRKQQSAAQPRLEEKQAAGEDASAETSGTANDIQLKKVAEMLKKAHLHGKISHNDGINILNLLNTDKLSPERAVLLIEKMCSATENMVHKV